MAGDLEQEAEGFALQLMERLARVLPSGDLGFTCEAIRKPDGTTRMAVASAQPGGLVLTIDRIPRLQLEVDFNLIHSPESEKLTVVRSTFLARSHDTPRPLFTFDYVRDAGSQVPAAHYNFHFEHGEITAELLAAGAQKRGKIHRRKLEQGKPPLLRDVHFPVGGHRFRPCLEDVLEMLILEFGIDVRPTAGTAIREGRARWRAIQTRAATTDDPASALEALRELGFEITPPHMGNVSTRLDRVEAL